MGLLLNQPVGCLCLFGGQKCGITHLYGAFLRQVHMGGKPHCPNRTDDSSAPSKKDLAHCCREARINDTTVPDSKKFLTMDLGFAHHAHLKNMKGQGCILPSWRLQTSRLRAENPSKTSSPFITDIQSYLCARPTPTSLHQSGLYSQDFPNAPTSNVISIYFATSTHGLRGRWTSATRTPNASRNSRNTRKTFLGAQSEAGICFFLIW